MPFMEPSGRPPLVVADAVMVGEGYAPVVAVLRAVARKSR